MVASLALKNLIGYGNEAKISKEARESGRSISEVMHDRVKMDELGVGEYCDQADSLLERAYGALCEVVV